MKMEKDEAKVVKRSMNKRVLSIIGAIALGLVAGVVVTVLAIRYEVSKKNDIVHVHADFAMVIEGEKLDFSGAKYMHAAPCVTQNLSFPLFAHTALAHSAHVELSEDAHLHNFNGNVVHVHKKDTSWHDFFNSVGITIDPGFVTDQSGNKQMVDADHEIAIYLNGQKKSTEVIYDEIHDLDRLLISFGPKDGAEARVLEEQKTQLTSEACIPSGSCPDRGVAPVESCGAAESKESFLSKVFGLED